MQISVILLIAFIRLCDIVEKCVIQYFITFRYCWKLILISFTDMIKSYIQLLNNITKILTSYPTCLYATISIFICMFFITIIIKYIFELI